MPGLDRKGPQGDGAMTGRQKGMCRRTESQPFDGRGLGRGMGRGMGGRRGMGQGGARGIGQGVAQKQSTEQNYQAQPEPRKGTLGTLVPRDVSPKQQQVLAGQDELQQLHKEYQAAQKMLKTLEQKIQALESKE